MKIPEKLDFMKRKLPWAQEGEGDGEGERERSKLKDCLKETGVDRKSGCPSADWTHRGEESGRRFRGIS